MREIAEAAGISKDKTHFGQEARLSDHFTAVLDAVYAQSEEVFAWPLV